MKKTFGNLIDELTITNQKIWNFEDIKRDPSSSDEVIANATRQTNHLNWYRNKLIQSIDELCTEMGLEQDCYKQGDTKSYAE